MTRHGPTWRLWSTPSALAGIGARRVVAVNASAYFSRPGPRLIDGLELLAHIFHPELVAHATGEALAVELQIPMARGGKAGERAAPRRH